MTDRTRDALLELLGDRGVSSESNLVIKELIGGRRMFSISFARRLAGASARTVKRFCRAHGVKIVSAPGRSGSQVDLIVFLEKWESSGIERVEV